MQDKTAEEHNTSAESLGASTCAQLEEIKTTEWNNGRSWRWTDRRRRADASTIQAVTANDAAVEGLESNCCIEEPQQANATRTSSKDNPMTCCSRTKLDRRAKTEAASKIHSIYSCNTRLRTLSA